MIFTIASTQPPLALTVQGAPIPAGLSRDQCHAVNAAIALVRDLMPGVHVMRSA
jgi:hypothetical protein